MFRSRISEAKFRQILRLFCLNLTATQIAAVVGISRNSINKYL
ncbi:MAG: IS1595 family transposase, partial [Balneola sp.]